MFKPGSSSLLSATPRESARGEFDTNVSRPSRKFSTAPRGAGGPPCLIRPGRILAAFATIMLVTGCADVREELTAGAQRLPEFFAGATTSEGFWRGDDVRGSPKIVVHVGEQRAYFYKGRNLVGESTVSTGKRGFDTPPGHYRVIQKDKDHISSEFGDYITGRGEVVKSNIDVRKDPQPPGTYFDGARMPYFLRFNGGYGMHAGYVPRFRASHGCIRLPPRMARHFFENAPEDTPVIVRED